MVRLKLGLTRELLRPGSATMVFVWQFPFQRLKHKRFLGAVALKDASCWISERCRTKVVGGARLQKLRGHASTESREPTLKTGELGGAMKETMTEDKRKCDTYPFLTRLFKRYRQSDWWGRSKRHPRMFARVEERVTQMNPREGRKEQAVLRCRTGKQGKQARAPTLARKGWQVATWHAWEAWARSCSSTSDGVLKYTRRQ